MTSFYKIGLVLSSIIFGTIASNAQSYVKNNTKTIPGNGQEIYDTINVTNLQSSIMSGSFGLDSVTLKLNYNNDQDLQISLIAPDGKVVQLANNLGGSGDNFNNTRFTMSVNNLVNSSSAPFNGKMRPESWLGNVNNGQNGNGNWVLHIINTATTNNTGSLLKWGVHFTNTPAPPSIFSNSTLPIIAINTNNKVINHITKSKVTGTMGIISNSPQINHLGDAFNNYDGRISIKVRGSSSASFAQHSYTVTTQTPTGSNLSTPLLGMPAGSKWVLYGAWDDKSLIRNILTYNFSNAMGDYAPRTKLVELVLNGDYQGVYVLIEKIEKGTDRVNVESLASSTSSGVDLTGGYIFQVDRGDGQTDSWYSQYGPCDGSNKKISFVYEYPDVDDINAAQKNYIAAYVDSFETALKSTNLYDSVNGYRRYIDVPSFIDQSLLQELGHNVDGYRLSSYLHKAKNQKLKGGPIWDLNLGYGNADYYNGSVVNTYVWNFPCSSNDGNQPPFWWKKFATDTVYMQELKCRYTNLRQNVFDTAHISFVMDSLKTLLQVPQSRNFTRWPILGVYLWPNAYVGNTWAEEMNYLNTWIKNRITWMDSQLYDSTCALTPNGINSPRLGGDQIKIYPNPSSGIVTIQNSDGIIKQIRIFNSTGALVLEKSVNSNSYTLNLKENMLNTGMYSVVISTKNGTVAKKVVLLEN